jgi:[protein-PII] uridylyltransferase
VGRRNRPLSDGLVMRDGDVHLDPSARPAEDPVLLVRAAATAARSGAVIDRMSLDRFVAEAHTLPDPWPRSARDQFVGLLLAGASAIPVIEAFDHRDLWVRILPEWAPVRSRPQRNAYHRYTVDRHLLETVARAASFAGRVERPDLLVVAALLHDLGKVDTRDHTEVGVELAHTVGVRLGFEPTDVDVLAELVHNHLLLSEVALRRDLDDPATSARVAEQVSSVGALQLLAALTEADSLATGPAAWGPAKAQLVALLVERVTHVLEGGEPAGIIVPVFPSELHLAQLARAGTVIEAAGDVLTVMTDDRAGVFSKVSGVLALHGLDVVSASAHSTDDGRALAEFHVNDPVRDAAPWDRVERDLLRAFDGRLALQARVADRARAYAGRQRATAWRPRTATVKFDNDASLAATVIDVHASDGIGVLYRITRALAELDVDIRSARVQTLGAQVVDAFYVVDRHGRKVTDADTSAEIERAIVHNLSV